MHTAVWTGSEMIVWGGEYDNGSNPIYLNDGGRYNPVANTGRRCRRWRSRRDACAHGSVDGQRDDRLGRILRQQSLRAERRRALQSGGQQLDGPAHHRRARCPLWPHSGMDRHRDDRLGRSRRPTTSTTAGGTIRRPTVGRPCPPPARPPPAIKHTAVWTGSEMIVWGGCNNGYYYSTMAGATIRRPTVGRRCPRTARPPGATVTRPYGRARDDRLGRIPQRPVLISLNDGGRLQSQWPTPGRPCPPTGRPPRAICTPRCGPAAR